MLTIDIICIGKLKENYLKDAVSEYTKRLTKYCKLEIIELQDEKLTQNASYAEEQKIKEKECEKIKEKLIKIGKSHIICLDLKGTQYTSEEFSDKLSNLSTYGNSTITFIIGGSLGLTNEILSLSNEKISFSKMTFPHQLFRVFLLEQIFRAFKIQNNETYHH